MNCKKRRLKKQACPLKTKKLLGKKHHLHFPPYAFIVLVLFPLILEASFDVKISQVSLEHTDQKIKQKLQRFAKDIEQILPEKVKAGIGRPVTLSLTKKGPVLSLHLKEIRSLPQIEMNLDFSGGDFPRKAYEQLLEAFGILYNQLATWNETKQKNIENLERRLERLYAQQEDRLENKSLGVEHFIGRQEKLLQEARRSTLAITGHPFMWRYFNWDFKNGPHGKMSPRSMDPKEYETVEKTFAVNFSHFLLDPEFSCRRPSYYAYFQTLFHHTPFEDISCDMNFKVPLSATRASQAPARVGDLDPRRIWQIHYMIAGEGEDLSSTWGHAMYRLIVCKPERQSVGPECLADVGHHIVASFTAETDELDVNIFRGANILPFIEGYSSRLHFMPFDEIKYQYTVDEMRTMTSFPLKLSESEKQRLVLRLLETYWEYLGEYRFFSNNCVDEAVRLLKTVLPYQHPFQDETILTPQDFKEALKEYALIDSGAPQFYHSITTSLIPTFTALHAWGSFLNEDDFRAYVLNSTAQERKEIYQRFVQSHLSQSQKKRVREFFYRMESFILRHRKNRVYLKEAQWIKEHSSEDFQISSMFFSLKQLEQALLQHAFFSKGYGILLSQDIQKDALFLELDKKINSLKVQISNGLFEQVTKQEWVEIESIKENKDIFLGLTPLQ